MSAEKSLIQFILTCCATRSCSPSSRKTARGPGLLRPVRGQRRGRPRRHRSGPGQRRGLVRPRLQHRRVATTPRRPRSSTPSPARTRPSTSSGT
ncbi:hypothetical protein HBB16_01225 [Pseudonocardia sp. MCCB 268]|nr:hypothetical protein [Pseudonocardia cytotoxica]